MKKIIILFLCTMLFTASVSAQQTTNVSAKTEATKSKLTSKEVIDNYIKALGGKDKLEAVKTIIMENTLFAQGISISMTTKKMGNKYRSEQSVMGQKMVQVFDGEKGYTDQMGQKINTPADKIAELKKSRVIDALGYDPANFKTVTVEKIDNKDYNVLTSDKGKFYFDASTGLLYKSASKDGYAIMKNYMAVDGIQFPAEMEAEGKGQKITIKTTRVTINSGVSDADFK